MPSMTKTEAKRKVAELRRAAADITAALTPTPQWILDELGQTRRDPAMTAAMIRRSLDEIERLAAELRASLAP